MKSWISRIPFILQHLKESPQAVYTRPEVARLFNTGLSQAADLMKIAGGDVRHGIEATITRENLIRYVESSPEAIRYYAEQARLKRVAEAAREKEASHAFRFGKLIGDKLKPADQHIEFKAEKLAAGLRIEPGKLTILFADFTDLAYKLALLAMAEANDPAAFQKMCEAPEERKAPPVSGNPLDHAYIPPGTVCVRCGRSEAAHIDMTGALVLATPEEIARILEEPVAVGAGAH